MERLRGGTTSTASPKRIIAIAATSSAFGVIPIFMTGAIGVQLRDDLDLSAGSLGLLIAAGHGSFALTSTFMGGFVEKIGASLGLRVGAALSSLGMACIALFSQSALALGLLIGFAGAVNSLVQASTNLLLARGVPNERLGLAFGVKQSAAPLATFISGLSVPIFAVTVGWRWAFLAAAILAAPMAFLVPREQSTGREQKRRRAPSGKLDLKPLFIIAAGMGGAFAAANGAVAFLVSGAVDAGVSESGAGVLFAVGSAIGILARVAFGHVVDRHHRQEINLIIALLAGGAACFALLATGDARIMILVSPAVFLTAWAYPGLLLVAIVRSNPQAPAVATSIIGIGAGTGSVIGPITFGLIADTSYSAAFLVSAVALLVAIPLLSLGARHMATSDRERREREAHLRAA